MKKTYLVFIVFFLLIFYLLINTGIMSDDFDVMYRVKGKDLVELINFESVSYFIDTPLEFFTHYIGYHFFSIDNPFADNAFKILYIFLSFYLVGKFFQIYLNRQTAFWASFLFIFFPTHDASTYWFMAQYLTLSIAFYLYSYYLAYNNKLVLAFLLALIASFLSYGSTPVAISLFILFALSKEFKKGASLIIPNIVYMLYFIPVNIIFRLGSPRIIEKFSIAATLKQFVLQILTFIDSMFGPSIWLKIYYSFSQLSIISIIFGVLFTGFFIKTYREGNNRYNLKLIASFTGMLLLSFVMFAVTGRYPQIAFNLGNRVTIFGSLLLSYLIVLIPVSKRIKNLAFVILIFSILGISDHWKSWNLHQQAVIKNISNNKTLQRYQDDKGIYVSGNQYSKYGPISHIEFLSEDCMPAIIFILALEKKIHARSLNKRHEFKDGYLLDKKYNTKKKINGYINVYDSEKNTFFSLKAEEINDYIISLPSDNRHWIYIFNVKFINNLVVKLMPRLKYAFN